VFLWPVLTFPPCPSFSRPLTSNLDNCGLKLQTLPILIFLKILTNEANQLYGAEHYSRGHQIFQNITTQNFTSTLRAATVAISCHRIKDGRQADIKDIATTKKATI
jgi:hypothetical protein